MKSAALACCAPPHHLHILLLLFSTARSYTVVPFLDESFGAEVHGLDTAELLALPAVERQLVIDSLEDDLHHYRLLKLADQELDIPQQIAFSQLFGELYDQNADVNRAKNTDSGLIALFSNQKQQGALGVGIEGFHVDGNVAKVPHRITIKYCEHAIEGGDTMFTPLNELSRVLSQSDLLDKVEFRSRLVVESIHPLIYPHPWTGLDTMMFGLGILSNNKYLRDGVEMTEQATTAVMVAIEDAIGQVSVFTQKWSPKDLVIVDNLALAHIASPGTQDSSKGLRLLRRTTVKGTTQPSRRRPLSSFPHRTDGNGHTIVSLASYANYGDPAEGTFHTMQGAQRLCRYALGPRATLAVLNTQDLQDMATELVAETAVPHWLAAREEEGNLQWLTGANDTHWSHGMTAPLQPPNPPKRGDGDGEAALAAWKRALPHPWDDISGQPNDCSGPMSEPCVFIGPAGRWFDFACAPKTGKDETPGPEITWTTGVRRMYNVHPMCSLLAPNVQGGYAKTEL